MSQFQLTLPIALQNDQAFFVFPIVLRIKTQYIQCGQGGEEFDGHDSEMKEYSISHIQTKLTMVIDLI